MDARRSGKRYRVLAVVSIVLTMIVPVETWAHDSERTGSIAVELNDIGSDRSGVTFHCYQIARVLDGEELSWELLPGFMDSGVDVRRLDQAEDYRKAADILAASKGKPDASCADGMTDANGVVKFVSLEQGIYLIEQAGAGKYGTVEPFLVEIPYMEDGREWIYDVRTSTKGEGLASESKDNPPQKTKNNKQAVKEVKTGDDAMMERYAVMAGIAGGVVIVVGALRYQRRKKGE